MKQGVNKRSIIVIKIKMGLETFTVPSSQPLFSYKPNKIQDQKIGARLAFASLAPA
jgi:hypothetical protein